MIFGNSFNGLDKTRDKIVNLTESLKTYYSTAKLYSSYDISLAEISSNDLSNLQQYINLLNKGANVNEAFNATMLDASSEAQTQSRNFAILNDAYRQGVISEKEYTVATKNLSTTQKIATASSEALAIGLNLITNLGIMFAITAITKGVSLLADKLIVTKDELVGFRDEITNDINSLKDNTNELVSNTQSVNELVEQYKQLASSVEGVSSHKDDLIQIQNSLVDSFGKEAESLDLINGKYDDNIKKIKELSELEYQRWKRENADKISEAEKTSNFNLTKDNLSWNSYENTYGVPIGTEDRKLLNSLYRIEDIDREARIIGERKIDGVLAGYKSIFSNKDAIVLTGTIEEARDQLGELIDKYSQLSHTDDETMKSLSEHYAKLSNIIDSNSEYLSKINAYENKEISTSKIINSSIEKTTESIGDLRSAWFESLDEMQKSAFSNIDKMDKAFESLNNGNLLSSSDFWDLAELDTGRLLNEIDIINGEYKISQKELIALKDDYIKKQVESLELTQAQIIKDKESYQQKLTTAKKELEDLGKYNETKYGSANMNNPAYRDYLSQLNDINSRIKTAENNVEELGDEWSRNNILIKEYNSRLRYTAEMSKAIAEQYANALLDSIDDKIKAVEKEKQALEDEKQVLQDQLDILEEQQKAIEEQIENYKTVVGVIEDEINKQTEALKKQQEAEEEAIQAKIDALKEAHEQREEEEELLEKELAVQEKLRDLEKAKNTKVRTYSSARGWHYDVDKEAVSNAQSAVSEAQKAYDEAVEKREYEKQLKDLEEQKAAVSKSYEERIQEYEDYTEQWKSLLEEQSKAEEERLADEILGVNWREKIKEKDVNILTGFQTKFRQYNTDLSNLVNNEIGSLKKSIKAKEDEIKAIGDTINKWNDYKTQVQDAINTVNNKFNDMKNVVGDLKTYMTADNSDLDNIESRVATFASNYSAYMELATQNTNNYTNAIYEQNDALEKNADKLSNDIQVWEGMIDAIKRFREQGIGINGESDAAYYSGEEILSMHWNDEQKRVSSYADGGVIDYTGTANVHGSKQKSEIALSAAQGRSLYDMIRTGNFSNLVASKAIEGLNRAMITNATTSNNNSTSVTIQSMNINGVQNPAQFAKEFNKNMEQYLQNEIIKSKVR